VDVKQRGKTRDFYLTVCTSENEERLRPPSEPRKSALAVQQPNPAPYLMRVAYCLHCTASEAGEVPAAHMCIATDADSYVTQKSPCGY
jgi:hypothetical protein